MSMFPFSGGGGGGGGGPGGGDDTYNIFVNIDLSGATIAFGNLNQQFNQVTQNITQNITNISQSFQQVNQAFTNINNMGFTWINTMNSVSSSTNVWMTGLRGLESMVGRIAGHYQVIGAAIATARALGESMREAESEREKRGGKSSEWRLGLREVAAMATGLPGGDMEETVQSQFRLMRAGMTKEEARTFAQGYGGYAAVNVATGKVDPETNFKTMEAVGRIAVALGGDLESMSHLAGTLSQRQGAGVSPVQTPTDFANLMRGIGFGPGASGKMAGQAAQWFTEALPSLDEESGGKMGIFKNDPRATLAFFTAISQGVGPTRAATTTSAAAAALMGIGRGSEQFGEWQKDELGIEDQTPMTKRIELVVAALRKRAGMSVKDFDKGIQDIVASQEGTTEASNLMMMLKELGLNTVQGRRGVAATVSQYDTFRNLMNMPEVTPAQVSALEQRFAVSPAGQAARARGLADVGELQGGMRFTNYTDMLRAARGKLGAEPGSTVQPESMPENALDELARLQKWTGDFTEDQRAVVVEATRQAMQASGRDIGAMARERGIKGAPAEGKAMTQEFILQMAKSGELNELIDVAMERRQAELEGRPYVPRQPPDMRGFNLKPPEPLFAGAPGVAGAAPGAIPGAPIPGAGAAAPGAAPGAAPEPRPVPLPDPYKPVDSGGSLVGAVARSAVRTLGYMLFGAHGPGPPGMAGAGPPGPEDERQAKMSPAAQILRWFGRGGAGGPGGIPTTAVELPIRADRPIPVMLASVGPGVVLGAPGAPQVGPVAAATPPDEPGSLPGGPAIGVAPAGGVVMEASWGPPVGLREPLRGQPAAGTAEREAPPPILEPRDATEGRVAMQDVSEGLQELVAWSRRGVAASEAILRNMRGGLPEPAPDRNRVIA